MIPLSREIHKFKIAKKYIKDFPFDLFYVVHQDQKADIPRMFPHSLAMGLTPKLIKCSKYVRLVYSDYRPHDDRLRRHKFSEDSVVGNLRTWLENNRHEYLCVVPVLMRWKRPDYLVAGRHRTVREFSDRTSLKTVSLSATDILNDQTVLFTPDGPVRPICLKCPRHLVHVTKKDCELGSQFCMENLDLLLRKGNNEQLPQHDIQHDPVT